MNNNSKTNEKKSGSRTLLLSVIMSSPGPLVVGLGLLSGTSSTQIADFVRRTSELLGIIMAYVVYKITAGKYGGDSIKKEKLERASNIFVGAMMCLGGSIMLLLAIFNKTEDKGNVIPGLVIAVLGVIANTAFWIKYTRLNREDPNAIIEVQARLYRAKSLVDTCVTVALLSVAIAPGSQVSYYLDTIGSIVVAVYLVHCGIKTLYEKLKKK